MDPKNIALDEGSDSYFIEDQYQKDTNFDYEDAYYHYDIDVDRISLYKKVTMNILLGIIIIFKGILYHCNKKYRIFTMKYMIIIAAMKYILKTVIKDFLRQ